MTKVGFAALVAAIAIGSVATPGYASTITDKFTFSDASNAVLANGSFSYDSSKHGLIGYADLSAFAIQMHIGSSGAYDLAFVNSGVSFVHFGFNTVANQFILGLADGTPTYLSAIQVAGVVRGFIVTTSGLPGNITDYSQALGPVPDTWTKYSITQVAATPVPATLPLLVSALSGIGLVGWRRRKNDA